MASSPYIFIRVLNIRLQQVFCKWKLQSTLVHITLHYFSLDSVFDTFTKFQLLQYLGHTSPECLENFNRKLNEPAPPPMSLDLENEAIACVISQRNMEIEESKLSQQMDSMSGQVIVRPTRGNPLKTPSSDSQFSNEGMYIFHI